MSGPWKSGFSRRVLLVLLSSVAISCGDSGPAPPTDGGANANGNQTGPVCGDGITELPEACDEGSANSDVDPDACRTDCTTARCGDGVIDAGETCDDGPANRDDLPDACRTICVPARCGDGIVDALAGETCDCGDGPGTKPDRCDHENSDEDVRYCPTDCVLPHCGDGIRLLPEECEGADLGGETCDSLGYYGGTLGCLPSCEYDFTECGGHCGDGIVNGEEVCDGLEPDGMRCSELGYDGGHVGCSDWCAPNLDTCLRRGWVSLFSYAFGVNYRGIWGTSSTNLWVVRDTGQLLHRSAYGWEEIAAPAAVGGQTLNGMWGMGPASLVMVGTQGTILRYEAGIHTTEVSGTTQTLRAVWGLPGDGIFAVGDGGTILHHDGVAWTARASGTTQVLNAVWGISGDDVWAAGDGGTLLHHDGVEWSVMASPTALSLRALAGRSGDDLYAAGDAGAVFHFDGTVWTDLSFSHDDAPDLVSVWPAPGGAVYSAGGGWMIRHDGWRWLQMNSTGSGRQIGGFSEEDLWAVGDDGSVIHFTGFDDPWTIPPYGSDLSLTRVWGTAPEDLYVAGQGGGVGMIYHWVGTGWMSPEIPVVDQVTGIWASPAAGAWACSYDGHVMHDDGWGWHLVNGVAPVRLGNIRGAPTGEVFTVGDALYRVDGVSLRQIAIPGYTGLLLDLAVVAADDVWVGGDGGLVAHWDGVDWESFQPDPTYVGSYLVWAAATGEVYVAGDGGRRYRRDGAGWTAMSSDSTAAVLSLYGSSSTDVFAIGAESTHWAGRFWTEVGGRYLAGADLWGAPGTGYWLVDGSDVIHYVLLTRPLG